MCRTPGIRCSASSAAARRASRSCSRLVSSSRERARPQLRPVPQSHHVSDPRPSRPRHRLRRPFARQRRAEVPELAGDAGLSQRAEPSTASTRRGSGRTKTDADPRRRGLHGRRRPRAAGIEPVVATLGTATTAEHIRRLTRLADRVVFCFDGDRAGRAAAWRALETALAIRRRQHRAQVPATARRRRSRFLRARAAATSAFVGCSAAPCRSRVPRRRATRAGGSRECRRARRSSSTLARPLLARLPQGVYRELLMRRARGCGRARGRALREITGSQGSATRGAGARPRGPAGGSGLRPHAHAQDHHADPALPGRGGRGCLPSRAGNGRLSPARSYCGGCLKSRRADPQIMTAQAARDDFVDDPEGRYLARLAGRAAARRRARPLAVLARQPRANRRRASASGPLGPRRSASSRRASRARRLHRARPTSDGDVNRWSSPVHGFRYINRLRSPTGGKLRRWKQSLSPRKTSVSPSSSS